MTNENFIYWLQGMIEGNPTVLEKGLTPEQVQIIQDHISLVMKKVTPTVQGNLLFPPTIINGPKGGTGRGINLDPKYVVECNGQINTTLINDPRISPPDSDLIC